MGIPVCTVDANGLYVPELADIIAFLKDSFRATYGQDIYLENDSQDGQLIGIFAAALNDQNAAFAAAYNAFSPATAQGTGLSSVVKTNGITRNPPTYSSVDLLCVGQVGITVKGGIATDGNSATQWFLPDFTFPNSGAITVTALCQTLGAVTAGAGSVNTIATPTLGWQSVTNPAAATPGAPVETDAQLRARQAISTMIPSQTVLEGLIGEVAAITGVARYASAENDTDVTDDNGLPPHSISLVVEGGDDQTIANAIALKKGPGVATYGTTTETVIDAYGMARPIKFSRPQEVELTWQITVRSIKGFTSAINTAIKQAVVDWTNARAIGEDVLLTRTYLPLNLYGGAGSETYEVLSVLIGRNGMMPAAADVTLAYDEAATSALPDVTITVQT